VVKRASVLTHRRLAQTAPAVVELLEGAERAGVTLHFSREEADKHRLAGSHGVVLDHELAADVDLCLALGGDGTILTALRRYAGTDVPVFGINFGEVGFLATADPDEAGAAAVLERAFAGDFDTLALPTIAIGRPEGTWIALNDVSVHRKPGLRVADLAYGFSGEELGRVRCDGLVVATPAGSTGYNLANGGPVLAWGVAGYVVSFVSPHSFTARPLVVAPDDELTIHNASLEEPVDIYADGRPMGELPAGADIHVEFGGTHALLAQLSGASFYHRLRERFGRLAR
jgi:NAD+ kinase